VTNIIYVPIHIVERGVEKNESYERPCVGPLIVQP
jgi:hypothetical protein